MGWGRMACRGVQTCRWNGLLAGLAGWLGQGNASSEARSTGASECWSWQRGRARAESRNRCRRATMPGPGATRTQPRLARASAGPPPASPACPLPGAAQRRTGALPEGGVLLAQLLVDLHVAASLAHHPHGGALHRLAAQRAQHERVVAAALPRWCGGAVEGERGPGWEGRTAGASCEPSRGSGGLAATR